MSSDCSAHLHLGKDNFPHISPTVLRGGETITETKCYSFLSMDFRFYRLLSALMLCCLRAHNKQIHVCVKNAGSERK